MPFPKRLDLKMSTSAPSIDCGWRKLRKTRKIGIVWLHVPSDMKNGIIRNDYMIQQQQRVTDTSYSGLSGGGHFMTYYTSSKYYGHTHVHDNIVPWALRALGTKTVTWISFDIQTEENSKCSVYARIYGGSRKISTREMSLKVCPFYGRR